MPQTDSAVAIRDALKNQYHASLAMLGDAISHCPDELWTSRDDTNAFWQIAYHTLFFAHFYSQPDEGSFSPWQGHQTGSQYPDAIPGPPDPKSDLPLLPDPYTKAQILEYWRWCVAYIDDAIDAVDLFASDCGFPWYPIPKLEHLMVNLRHIQHGAAQLADRLRRTSDVGVDWAATRPA